MKYNMALFRSFLATALLGLIFTSCGQHGNKDRHTRTDRTATGLPRAASPESLALVPGVSAGTFKLGEADSSVYQQLGRPDYSDAAMGKAVLLWYTDTAEGHPFSIFTARDMGNDETARIQQIRVTSPAFKTAESIHVGSPLTEISAHYQIELIETYENDGDSLTVYDSDRGIAFEIGPDGRCVAVIIHSADADATTYLPLRPVD